MTMADWKILAGLDPAVSLAVLQSTTRHRYRKNDVVFSEGEEGDALHLVEHGRAAVRVSTPEGDCATMKVIGPGSFFGEQALLGSNRRRMATVVALESLETLTLRRQDFDRLRSQHSTVETVLVEALSQRVSELTDRLMEAYFLNVEQRLCRRLLEIGDVYAADNGIVSVPLTQQELAYLTGTSRPTMNVALHNLEREAILSVKRGRVELLDRPALERRCH